VFDVGGGFVGGRTAFGSISSDSGAESPPSRPFPEDGGLDAEVGDGLEDSGATEDIRGVSLNPAAA
jgi:hypothetical protein